MAQTVDRLKQLLFDSESRELTELRRQIDSARLAGSRDADELSRRIEAIRVAEAYGRADLAHRVEQLGERVGTPDRLRASMAEVIDGALRDAETKKHDQMARAVAPIVTKTIRTELRNSRDEMVDVLYPVMGRLVKAYVVSAVKDMTDQINRRIESNAVMLRLRSIASGRTVAELAMADGQRLEVEELFLVRRGSGELVQHWPESKDDPGSDIHLSSVLTAINEFAAQGFKGEGGNLRAFEVDTFTVFLRASPAYLLAAKCHGSAPPGVETVLDEEFLQTIERNQAALSGSTSRDGASALQERVLAPLATSLETRLAERQSELASPARTITPVRLLLALILLPLLAWFGWRTYSDYVTNEVRIAAQQVIDGTPDLLGYPTTLDIAANGRVITVGGLAPSALTKASVIERMRERFAASSVVDRVNVVAGAVNEAMPQIARVRSDLASLESEIARSRVRRQLERALQHLVETSDDLSQLEASIDDQARRSAVQAAGRELGEVQQLIKDLSNSAAMSDGSSASLSAIATPIDGLTERVRRATARISPIVAQAAAASRTTAPAGRALTGALESAEQLSAATERAHAVAAATLQTAQIKPPPPGYQPGPREQLDAWVRGNAFFFGAGTDYRAPAASAAKLATLVRLLKSTPASLRVIGYTDETGGAARNAPLAMARAEKVAADLVERGIARERLIVIGRGAGLDLAASTGPNSANRRVEFQVAFEGEVDEAR